MEALKRIVFFHFGPGFSVPCFVLRGEGVQHGLTIRNVF